jgi:hypothetical protein
MDNLLIILIGFFIFCAIAVVGEYFFGDKND